MVTETPVKEEVTVTHEFNVILPGDIKGKLTIVVNENNDVLRVTNGTLLAAVNPSRAAPLNSFQAPSSQVAGIRKIKNADGTVSAIPSDKVKNDIRLFVDSIPCWFPECEALRAEYKAEFDVMPADCPACEKGALIRKYLKKMETINTDEE
jgi:hypothetical protein